MGLLGLFVSVELGVHFRPVAQLAEQRSPKPQVGGSIPSWPATTGLWLVCFNFLPLGIVLGV